MDVSLAGGAVRAVLVTRLFGADKRTLDAGERPFEACADAMNQATRQVADGLVRMRETVHFGLAVQRRGPLPQEQHLRAGIDAQVVHG